MKKVKLTKKELQILSILWKSDSPLTAKQIIEKDSSLGMSTVQSVLKRLSKSKMVENVGIVYSGTVLTRSYSPTISEEDFILNQYENIDISKLLTGFLGDRSDKALMDDISKIEEIIKEKKREME